MLFIIVILVSTHGINYTSGQQKQKQEGQIQENNGNPVTLPWFISTAGTERSYESAQNWQQLCFFLTKGYEPASYGFQRTAGL